YVQLFHYKYFTKLIQPTGSTYADSAASYISGSHARHYNRPVTNDVGTIGLIVAVMAILFSWVPVVDWVIWFLAAFLSFIGSFKHPRGFAIAGIVICGATVMVKLTVAGLLAASGM
ncbi:MAG: hypothetical protein LIP02_00710, partial [Bacteroidales bacterium]|nr:hypothetical protein [Bacteroidales bacterium]